MNLIGVISRVVFIVAWFGALAVWFVAAYHMAKGHVAFWRSKPSPDQMLRNMFWFVRGIPGLREAFSSTPATATPHFLKSLKYGLIFTGFIALGMAAGLVGVRWGDWQN